MPQMTMPTDTAKAPKVVPSETSPAKSGVGDAPEGEPGDSLMGVRRPRKPGECASRKAAIRNHCLECVGYQQTEVRECTDKDCWLYPFRMGRLDRDALELEAIHAQSIYRKPRQVKLTGSLE